MIRCSMCKEHKECCEFHVDNSHATGRTRYCKPCRSEYRYPSVPKEVVPEVSLGNDRNVLNVLEDILKELKEINSKI